MRQTFFVPREPMATLTWRRSLSIGAAIVTLGVLTAFLRSTPDAWPYGDEAVIQTYVLHALRGALVQGPYSQFGWHHPGPLYFYLLAPAYALSGQHAIGLTVGALTINLLALWIVWWLTLRHADSVVAAVLLGALAWYVWHAQELPGSIWNPHVIVLPLAAALVAAAAACNGDRAGMLLSIVLTSFLMQTHVSMVPIGIALLAIVLVATIRLRGTAAAFSTRSLLLAGAIGAALWLPPAIDAVRTHGRNLLALTAFFQQRGQTPDIKTALRAWSGMLAAPTMSGFHIPWGTAALTPAPPGTGAVVAGQFVALMLSLVFARKTRQRFLSLLAALLVMTSGLALLSIVRIRGGIFDYQIFWLSGIGALIWGTSAAVLTTLLPNDARSSSPALTYQGLLRSLTSLLIGITSVVLVAGASLGALTTARAYAIGQQSENVRRKDAALAVRQVFEDRHFRRPLFTASDNVWIDATCVVLDAYKHHPDLAVDSHLVKVFGDTLAPNGQEDAEIVVAGPQLHEELLQRPGTVTIFTRDGLFVDVRPLKKSGDSQ